MMYLPLDQGIIRGTAVRQEESVAQILDSTLPSPEVEGGRGEEAEGDQQKNRKVHPELLSRSAR